jgi:hypothetical protein
MPFCTKNPNDCVKSTSANPVVFHSLMYQFSEVYVKYLKWIDSVNIPILYHWVYIKREVRQQLRGELHRSCFCAFTQPTAIEQVRKSRRIILNTQTIHVYATSSTTGGDHNQKSRILGSGRYTPYTCYGH